MRHARVLLVLILVTIAHADQGEPFVEVQVYDQNNDYLEFKIHLERIEKFAIVRNAGCTITLQPKTGKPTQKTVWLTESEPHYFIHERATLVRYWAHGLRDLKAVDPECTTLMYRRETAVSLGQSVKGTTLDTDLERAEAQMQLAADPKDVGKFGGPSITIRQAEAALTGKYGPDLEKMDLNERTKYLQEHVTPSILELEDAEWSKSPEIRIVGAKPKPK